jgi:hypothetical protein
MNIRPLPFMMALNQIISGWSIMHHSSLAGTPTRASIAKNKQRFSQRIAEKREVALYFVTRFEKKKKKR